MLLKTVLGITIISLNIIGLVFIITNILSLIKKKNQPNIKKKLLISQKTSYFENNKKTLTFKMIKFYLIQMIY